MIALASDFLLFQVAGGESVPFSPEMIAVELTCSTADASDLEFVTQAVHAVFHYFKSGLGRHVVSVEGFSGAMVKVLAEFEPTNPGETRTARRVAESDLCRLAGDSGAGCELFFFARLRNELRHQLSSGPHLLRFRGLRPCVRQLVGARHWTRRCRILQEQIVHYLRDCLNLEKRQAELAMVVE